MLQHWLSFLFIQRGKNSDMCREEEENRDGNVSEGSYNQSRIDDTLFHIIPKQDQGGIYTWVSMIFVMLMLF